MSFNQFLHSLWVVLVCQWDCVKTLSGWLENFGGDSWGIEEKFIGVGGKSCANQKPMGLWVLKTYVSLVTQCWLSKCDGWFMILIRSSIRFLRQNNFQIVQFSKLSNHWVLMLERVFWSRGKSSLWGLDGEWEMVD